MLWFVCNTFALYIDKNLEVLPINLNYIGISLGLGHSMYAFLTHPTWSKCLLLLCISTHYHIRKPLPVTTTIFKRRKQQNAHAYDFWQHAIFWQRNCAWCVSAGACMHTHAWTIEQIIWALLLIFAKHLWSRFPLTQAQGCVMCWC